MRAQIRHEQPIRPILTLLIKNMFPDNYNYSGFLKIQQDVSESIIRYTDRKLSKEEINLDVQTQRFPYPGFVENGSLASLGIFMAYLIFIGFSFVAVNNTKAITLEKESQLKVK